MGYFQREVAHEQARELEEMHEEDAKAALHRHERTGSWGTTPEHRAEFARNRAYEEAHSAMAEQRARNELQRDGYVWAKGSTWVSEDGDLAATIVDGEIHRTSRYSGLSGSFGSGGSYDGEPSAGSIIDHWKGVQKQIFAEQDDDYRNPNTPFNPGHYRKLDADNLRSLVQSRPDKYTDFQILWIDGLTPKERKYVFAGMEGIPETVRRFKSHLLEIPEEYRGKVIYSGRGLAPEELEKARTEMAAQRKEKEERNRAVRASDAILIGGTALNFALTIPTSMYLVNQHIIPEGDVSSLFTLGLLGLGEAIVLACSYLAHPKPILPSGITSGDEDNEQQETAAADKHQVSTERGAEIGRQIIAETRAEREKRTKGLPDTHKPLDPSEYRQEREWETRYRQQGGILPR